jgi:hypothetical protein
MRKIFLLSLMLLGGPALAGPPFVTDDPEPVDYQHFEINTAMQGTYIKDGRSGNWPNMDINYGLAPDVQFHVNLYAPFAKDGGDTLHYGYGDSEVGVKYRFIQEDDEGWRPQVAIYPAIDFATGKFADGLGAGHRRIFLPVWAQKSFGDWTSFGGGGYWLNSHANTDKNYWFMGWALLRKFGEDWTLGGEIFHQTADLTGVPVEGGTGVSTRSSTGFNLGGYYNFNDENHIIFTFGRGLQNVEETNKFSYYVGYQLGF